MAWRRTAVHRRGHRDLTADGLAVVPMRRRHLKSVVAIEQQVFPTPWSLSLYLSELTMGATRAYFVAMAGNEVVGYAGLMLAVGEGHVTTIGVSPRLAAPRYRSAPPAPARGDSAANAGPRTSRSRCG